MIAKNSSVSLASTQPAISKALITVNIKRFDQNLPLPAYQTQGAAALDLSARLDVEIPSQTVKKIPLNIALQIPRGYWVLMSARSSLHKKGLMLANGIGVGDYDYRGNNDEYQAALLNFTSQPVIVKKGERIVQMMILPVEKIKLIEQDQFSANDRGGFGSTGK